MAVIKEIVILAPKEVIDKAKELSRVGYHDKALDLLVDNKIEFDVYSEKDIPQTINARLGTNLSRWQYVVKEEKKARWERGKRKAIRR